jgi:predicted neutral ceramidase superfamily lipid hydrolase
VSVPIWFTFQSSALPAPIGTRSFIRAGLVQKKSSPMIWIPSSLLARVNPIIKIPHSKTILIVNKTTALLLIIFVQLAITILLGHFFVFRIPALKQEN